MLAARLVFSALISTIMAGAAAADDFYKGRTLTIVVGFSPGGGFDLNARLLARHIGRHIPGRPDVVVSNMNGAASFTSVQYLDTIAPKDGTVIDTFNFGLIGDSKVFPERVKADFRTYNWIGSISQDITVCYTWAALGVKTLAELQKRPEVHMGDVGPGTSAYLNQNILKNIFHVNLKQVMGYPGSAEQRIAIERGELDGDCGAWSSLPAEWVLDHKVNPLMRSAPATLPDLPPEVPYMVDIAADQRSKDIIRLLTASGQVGRPFIASSAVPSDRIAILRNAFAETVRDPEFIAEGAKLRLPVSPKSADEALSILNEIYDAPSDLVSAARSAGGG